jgi:hypothetical protein
MGRTEAPLFLGVACLMRITGMLFMTCRRFPGGTADSKTYSESGKRPETTPRLYFSRILILSLTDFLAAAGVFRRAEPANVLVKGPHIPRTVRAPGTFNHWS